MEGDRLTLAKNVLRPVTRLQSSVEHQTKRTRPSLRDAAGTADKAAAVVLVWVPSIRIFLTKVIFCE